ncbi:hypothetical protein, partial [Endozoicomonas elysicola]
ERGKQTQAVADAQAELNRARDGLKAEQQKNGALEQKNGELQGKVSDAQEKARVAEQQLNQATSKLQASDARIEELELERGKQTLEVTEAQQKLKQAMDKEKSLRGELDRKQQVIERTEEKLRKQSEENVSLKSQLERSAEEKLVIESQRSGASNRADTLEHENSGLKAELEKLWAKVSSQGDQLTAFNDTKNKLRLAQAESDRLKDGFKRLERDIEKSDKEKKQFESQLHEKTRKVNNLTFELGKQSTRVKSLQREVESNSFENLDLKKQLSLQKKQVANAVEVTNQKRRQIEQERDRHNVELSQVKKEIQQAKGKLDSALDELQRVNSARRQEGDQFAAKENKYLNKIKELEKNLGILDKQLQEASTANTAAHKQVRDIKAQMVDLEKERDRLRRDIGKQQYMMHFEHSPDQIPEMEWDHSDMLEGLKQSKVDHQYRASEVETLKKELLDAKNIIKRLESDAKSLNGVNADNQSIRNKLEVVEKQLAVKQAALSKLVGKNNADIFNHYLNEMMRAMDERDDLAGKKEIEISAAVREGVSAKRLDDDTFGVHKANLKLATRLIHEKEARKKSDRLLNEKVKEVEVLKSRLGKS